jgi:hypothetical protein
MDFSIIEPMLQTAYERESDKDWRRVSRRLPTSFYISNFPGDEPLACGRAAVYQLMGIPNEKPIDIHAVRWMDAGKDLETQFVRRLAAEGMLLSNDETAGEQQTKFGDSEVWSSGAVDAIVLPFGWTQPLCVEIKNTSREKMVAMRSDRERGTPYSHQKYLRQLKTYVGYAHEQKFAPKVTVCTESWAVTRETVMGLRWCPRHHSLDCEVKEIQLSPPDGGELIYASRDPERGNHLDTIAYYVGYDGDFLEAGRKKLGQWRDFFERGEMPPHIHAGEKKKWSVDPCRFCNVKKNACKLDETAKVTQLADSHAFEFARELSPAYDYEDARAAVFARWKIADPLKREEPKS